VEVRDEVWSILKEAFVWKVLDKIYYFDSRVLRGNFD